MSSTLFARGINTQTGGRRKAEEYERKADETLRKADYASLQINVVSQEIAGLKVLMSRVEETMRDLENRIMILEAKSP
jgi:hypothetical protein